MPDYYVETTGNDSAVGSETQPFLTVGHAINVAVSGSTIYIGDGDFLEESISLDKDLIFIGNGRTSTILRFAQPIDEFQPFIEITSAVSVRFENIRIDGAYAPFDFTRNGLASDIAGVKLEIERCAIEGFINFYILVHNAELIVSDSQISLEPAYMNDVGIQAWDSNVVVTNVEIGDQVDHCIDLRGNSQAEITHCILNGYSLSNNHGIRLLDNVKATIGFNKILGKGSISAGINDNAIQAGIFLNDSASADIYHNVIVNFAIGILHSTHSRSRIWNNEISNNLHWGVKCYQLANRIEQPDLGGGFSGSPGKNVIKDNGGVGIGGNFLLQGGGTVYARFNDWGTSSITDIDSSISFGITYTTDPLSIEFTPILGGALLFTDAVFLLDRSGSMITSQKWHHAVSGLNLLAASIAHINCSVNNFRMGLVTFAKTNTTITQLEYPLASIPADITDFTSSLTTPEPFYMTPLGQGIIEAADVVGPVTLNTRKIIYLLSDGMNNFGPNPEPIAIGIGSDIQIHSLGYGDDTIGTDILQNISISTLGNYSLTGTTDALALHQGLFNLLPESLDVEVVLNTYAEGVSSFPINNGENRMLVAISWEDDPQHIEFDLEDPAGNVISPTALPANVSWHPDSQYPSACYVVNNPVAGDWKIVNISNLASSNIPSLLKFVALDPVIKSHFWIDKSPRETDEPLGFGAWFTEDGKEISDVKVQVEITEPAESQGETLSDFMKKNPKVKSTIITNKYLPKQKKLSLLFKEFKNPIHESKKDSIELFMKEIKDDLNAFSVGYFTPSKEGTYSFKFIAEGTSQKGYPFQRIAMQNAFITFKTDKEKTDVKIERIDDRYYKNRYRLWVYPKSHMMKSIGPFHSDKIQFRSCSVKFIGKIGEDGMGAYYRDFDAEEVTTIAAEVAIGNVKIPINEILVRKNT